MTTLDNRISLDPFLANEGRDELLEKDLLRLPDFGEDS
jgi:hypothetical protein